MQNIPNISVVIEDNQLIINSDDNENVSISLLIKNEETTQIIYEGSISIPPAFVLDISNIMSGSYEIICTLSNHAQYYFYIVIPEIRVDFKLFTNTPFNGGGGGNGGGIVAVIQGLQEDMRHKSTFIDFGNNAYLEMEIHKLVDNNKILPPVYTHVFVSGLPSEHFVDVSEFEEGNYLVSYLKPSEGLVITGEAYPSFTI